ncbi:RAD50-interacting protein 1 [Lampris incognitus]|uniref:RAD50-interacting protein 1 n=1 Tax=Lampris incognitus TaxID=2546036 RepID=UPI0024B4D52B|nr:RAD50-interacting protein 1 [Lampris incognitus]
MVRLVTWKADQKKMAAPTAEEVMVNKRSDESTNPVSTADMENLESKSRDRTLHDHVLDFIKTELGSDLKSLRNVGDLIERLSAEKEQLDKHVLKVSSSVPLKVREALSAAEEANTSLEGLLERERVLSNTLQQHLQGVQPWMDKFGQTLGNLETVERHIKYLQCLQHIEELSDSIQQCLMTNSVWEAINAIGNMASLVVELQESSCSHLQLFLRETLCFWHKIIKDRLASDFEEVLSLLQWPFIFPPTQSLAPPANSQEISSQLDLLSTQLLALQTSDNVISEKSLGSRPGVPSAPPLSLPIQIMLQPLRKRFRYHFTGNRQTNSLSKPEWYLTQVLMWMGNNSSFMEERLQPILDRTSASISARIELCRGLLSLAQEKLASDAPRLLYDDTLFCHLVDEVLHFEKELRNTYSYPVSLPGTLHILLEENTLQKWLAVEKKMALEKVDAMLSAEGAWSSQYRDISDIDELKAPECAETFMTLLLVITERYRSLPCPRAQLKFLELQMELVDDFRIRLTQVMKAESRSPLGARYCAILNAANYISSILGDWGDNVFFLQLQQAAVSFGEEEEDRGVLGNMGMIDVGRLASLEGSLFEGLIALLERLRGDMMGRLLDTVMRAIRQKVYPYRQDRWLSLPSQFDQTTMSLSSSACPMMLCLRDHLLNLQQLLCLPLFQTAWQGLADRLDNFFYQDVILYNHFNEGGAAQLQFDMTRNLFTLFGHYCKRPENFFKHVKEACIILNLKVGSALLLRDLLRESVEETISLDCDRTKGGCRQDNPSPESALNEIGVYQLAPSDVLILLSLRASWPGQ